MGFITTEEIERRKKAGIKMNKLNCGWNISTEDTAKIAAFIKSWKPKTETEKRDRHILELAFIHDMNASQIARLNDPLIIGMGNRSRGKPLSPSSILAICHKYAPNTKKKRQRRCTTSEERNRLFRGMQQQGTNRPKCCATCGGTDDIELHHIIPLAAGGTNDYYNLVYLCHNCHMKLHHNIYDQLKIFNCDDIE